MKKIVFTFGIIAGLICGAMFFIMAPKDGNLDFENGALYGYITMIVALSTIFFAVKQYRDKYNGGAIKFGKAFLVGLYITLIAAVVYSISWEIYYTNYCPGFSEQYLEYTKTKLVKEGKGEAEIETILKPQIEMFNSYNNSMILRLAFTSIEIIPVGLVISLISALIFGVLLKKKPEEIIAA